MPKNLKVYIADDHTLFRKAIENLISTFEGIGTVKGADNGKQLMALIKKDQPHVVLVDLKMPVMDGTEACEKILSQYPNVKIIVLTMHDNARYIMHMMEMGVQAFLLKNTEPDELEKAIWSVVERDFYHNNLIASVIRRNLKTRIHSRRPSFAPVSLTPREREVLQLVCQELTIREIAQRLSISENTARNHRVNMMEKLNVKNTVGLVRHAYEIGLIL